MNEAQVREWYAAQTIIRLHCMYRGAWDANDVDGAARVRDELARRGEPTGWMVWPKQERA